MQIGQASRTDTASQVVFSYSMVSMSLLGHEHRKRLQRPSGESELYAMSVGAAEALGFRELLTDIGLPTTVRLRCDSTAAMGTASRQGLGRMKHVQVRDLALQQWIADGRLTLQKIASSGNAADLLTKHVSQNVLQSLVPKLGLQQ